tara:strand:- start:3761 stop:4129 length:369 start_codon:yes stop_codon:yes gene_type:complete
MNIKPIKTDADHKQALARLELLMEAQPDTPEGDELDILATLVDAYERQHHAIEPPHPVEAIRFRMEQMGLVDADLTPIIGQRGRVSEVLNFKRPLTLPMIRRLNATLHIPAETLIPEYQISK